MLEAGKRIEELKVKEKAEKDKKEKEKVERKGESAVYFFNDWEMKGKPLDKNNNPKLGRPAAVAIVQVLMPRIAPKNKLGDHKNMKECFEWLGSVAGGWDEEMRKVREENVAAIMENAPRLF